MRPISVSGRLRCCAALVPPGGTVADVGCDHGYLSIYLLQQGIASRVVATDLREKPLARARENAALHGVADRMEFFRADGLQAVAAPCDTVVCAGMGGDKIAAILDACPWVQQAGTTLVLQPQTSGNDLRRYLGEHGYTIRQELLTRDAGRLYFAIQAVPGGGRPLTPGEQYLSPQLLAGGSPLLPAYSARILAALERALAGMDRAGAADPRRIYYSTALQEVKEMKRAYENSTGCL